MYTRVEMNEKNKIIIDRDILRKGEDQIHEDDPEHIQSILPRISSLSLPKISQGTSSISETMSIFTGLSLSPSLGGSLSSDSDELGFEEDEEFKSEEEQKEVEEIKKLSNREERAIKIKASRQLAAEFSKLKKDGREKMNGIRKNFKTVIDNARSTLIASRIEAEKESINRLKESAEQKHDIIRQNRLERRKQLQKEKKRNDSDKTRDVGWVKLELEEMASLRKVQADLDRARARRRYSLAAAVETSKGRVRVRNLMQTEVRRLERAEEVHKLILELHELNLGSYAIKLTHALNDREEKAENLKKSLKEEAARVKQKYEKRREDEISLLRRERFDELEKLEILRLQREKEQRERAEREKRERVMAALQRKAHNQAMRRCMENTRLSSNISRPYHFSYFPQASKVISSKERCAKPRPKAQPYSSFLQQGPAKGNK